MLLEESRSCPLRDHAAQDLVWEMRTIPFPGYSWMDKMASFLRRLSLRHAVAGGVLGVSGLSASGLAHALRIEEDTKLDFKDVLLRPKRSELSSRAQVRTP